MTDKEKDNQDENGGRVAKSTLSLSEEQLNKINDKVNEIVSNLDKKIEKLNSDKELTDIKIKELQKEIDEKTATIEDYKNKLDEGLEEAEEEEREALTESEDEGIRKNFISQIKKTISGG